MFFVARRKGFLEAAISTLVLSIVALRPMTVDAIIVGKLQQLPDEFTIVGEDWTFQAATAELAKYAGIKIKIDVASLSASGIDLDQKLVLNEVKQEPLDVLARLLVKLSPARKACVVILKHNEFEAELKVTAYSKDIAIDDLLYVQERL